MEMDDLNADEVGNFLEQPRIIQKIEQEKERIYGKEGSVKGVGHFLDELK